MICAGGGGVAVCDSRDAFDGLDAVIDPDVTAALLAVELNADRLLLLTDVDSVKRDFGTPHETAVSELDPLVDHHALPPESMGAKVAAASLFVAATGRTASIGRSPTRAGSSTEPPARPSGTGRPCPPRPTEKLA